MSRREIELNLKSVDSIFSTQEQREDHSRKKIVDIPLTE